MKDKAMSQYLNLITNRETGKKLESKRLITMEMVQGPRHNQVVFQQVCIRRRKYSTKRITGKNLRNSFVNSLVSKETGSLHGKFTWEVYMGSLNEKFTKSLHERFSAIMVRSMR